VNRPRTCHPGTRHRSPRHWWQLLVASTLMAAVPLGLTGANPVTDASSYQRISGEGSSWSANALDAMRVNVQQFGITVDYNPTGSTSGRKNFLNGTVDFAASDIPFQFNPEDGSAPENPAPGSYAYMPITAGGTAFMYNLRINGQRVTNLRLSGENAAKIFTGAITVWNDPAIAADNPGLTLPARNIVPVVRSEGSGSTAQLTAWMIDRHPQIWQDYCERSGRAPACGQTSFYPTIPGMIAQNGDLGVSGYVSQGFAEGAIGYVNYSYALGTQFPVVKLLNAAGFYTEPTPENVAVSLLKARINTDESNPARYLTQDLSGVYNDTDPRSYQLSSYSYLILPTRVGGQFNEAKGRTLGAFAYYAMCQAQQQSASLGYSPMPVNLVEASFEQIRKIPGVEVQNIDIAQCDNPTFSPDGTNVLAASAPQPKACDAKGPLQCSDGTAGLANVPTPVSAAAQGGAAPATGGGSTGAGGAPAAGGGSAQGSGAPATGGAAGAGGAPATGGGSTGAGGAPATGGGSTGTGGGSATGGVVDPATGAVSDPVTGLVIVPAGSGTVDPETGLVAGAPACDPSTGVGCAATGQSPTAGAAAVGAVASTVIPETTPWDASIAFVVLVILLVLAVVIVPAIAWRRFSGSVPT
jgi:phosphate ABC transporter phosphate-binding protein